MWDTANLNLPCHSSRKLAGCDIWTKGTTAACKTVPLHPGKRALLLGWWHRQRLPVNTRLHFGNRSIVHGHLFRLALNQKAMAYPRFCGDSQPFRNRGCAGGYRHRNLRLGGAAIGYIHCDDIGARHAGFVGIDPGNQQYVGFFFIADSILLRAYSLEALPARSLTPGGLLIICWPWSPVRRGRSPTRSRWPRDAGWRRRFSRDRLLCRGSRRRMVDE